MFIDAVEASVQSASRKPVHIAVNKSTGHNSFKWGEPSQVFIRLFSPESCRIINT